MQLKAVLALLAAAGAALAQQPFSMNTPTNSIIACVPLLLQWQGGAGPYTLLVHTYAGNPGPVIDTIPNLSGNSYTYTPKAAQVGQQLEFQLTDSTGANAQTAGTPAVLANSQCAGSSSAAGSSAAGSSSAAPSSSSSAAGGAGGAGGSSSRSSSEEHRSSSSAARPSSSSAAPSSSSEEHRSSSSAAPSSSSSSEASSSSAAAGSSSAAPSSSAAASSSAAPSAGPASSSSSQSPSGAGSLRVPAAVAGFVGLAAAALL